MGKLIRFDGRIRRSGFWISAIAVGIVYSIVYFIANSMGTDTAGGIVVVSILSLGLFALSIISLSISVRRWHDLNKSGWWVLISLIPIIGGLYALIMCGFKSGDQGHNSYGPAPVEGVLL